MLSIANCFYGNNAVGSRDSAMPFYKHEAFKFSCTRGDEMFKSDSNLEEGVRLRRLLIFTWPSLITYSNQSALHALVQNEDKTLLYHHLVVRKHIVHKNPHNETSELLAPWTKINNVIFVYRTKPTGTSYRFNNTISSRIVTNPPRVSTCTV